jgi:hypothetical protein
LVAILKRKKTNFDGVVLPHQSIAQLSSLARKEAGLPFRFGLRFYFKSLACCKRITKLEKKKEREMLRKTKLLV